MQNSRWFAKFPHPICATVLQKERPTPPPTLKKPAKTAPLPGKTRLKPNKAHPLPGKTQPLPQLPHKTYHNLSHPRPTTLPHVCGNGRSNTLLPNCALQRPRLPKNHPHKATKPRTTTGTLPTTLLCKLTTQRHEKSTKKTLGAFDVLSCRTGALLSYLLKRLFKISLMVELLETK